jgi:hypothetical protein
MRMTTVAVGLALVAVGFSIAAAQTAARAPQSSPPRDSRPMASAGTAVIRGQAVAADTGRPLSLATITASAPELGDARSISTNSQGRYELRRLPAGRYVLSISRSGYLRLQYGQRRPLELGKPIDVAAGQVVDNIDFILPRMSVISGRVTDEEGEPLAGARVTALPSNSYGAGRLLPPTGIGFTSTDDSGAYRITGLSPGSYAVVAETTASLFGSSEPGARRSEGYAATYFPGASDPAQARAVPVGIGEEAPNTDFSLALTRLATVTGTLVDSRGRPVPNQQIAIARQFAGLMVGASPLGGKTNDEGAFAIRNLTPGEITLIAGAGPGSTEAAIVTINIDGADISLPLTTSGGWSASGRLVASEGPLPAVLRNRLFVATTPVRNAMMSIRISGVGGPDAGQVNDDGTFSVRGVFGPARIAISGLPDGWTQQAVLYEGRNIAGKPIDIRDGEVASGIQIVLSNRLTSVTGLLTDANGLAPANGTVLVFADDSERWFQGSRFVRAARPDSKGHYEIKGMPPAGYLAVAVDYVTEFMWNDPDYLESLRPRAVTFTLGDGESQTLPLTLVTP